MISRDNSMYCSGVDEDKTGIRNDIDKYHKRFRRVFGFILNEWRGTCDTVVNDFCNFKNPGKHV